MRKIKVLIVILVLFQINNSQILTKVNKLEENSLNEIIPENIYFFNGQYLTYNHFNKTVDLLDEKFKFVKTIANNGDGPGEIRGGQILINEMKDKLVIVDGTSNRIQFYDKKGNFLEKLTFDNQDLFIENMLVKDDMIVFVTYGKLWFVKGKKFKSIEFRKLPAGGSFSVNFKELCFTEDNKLVLFWNDQYKISVFDLTGKLLYEIKNEKFKNYPSEDSEIKNKQVIEILRANKEKHFSSIAENIFVKNNYLYIVLTARAKNKFKQQVDVYDLRTKKFVKKLEGDEFKLLKSFCFSGDEIIAISEKKTKDDYEKIFVKAKLVFK